MEKSLSKLSLVYPIYLDTPMMTAFLASLEGGLVEETSLEERSSSSGENSGGGKGEFKVTGLLSGLVGGGVGAEFAKKFSEENESQFRSTVRFPTAALFIRLRNHLLENNYVKQIMTEDDLVGIEIGDLVEIQGMALPNPALQIRSLITQIVPIIEQSQIINQNQLEAKIQTIKKAKPGFSFTIGDEEFHIKDQADKSRIVKILEDQKKDMEDQAGAISMGRLVLEGLIPEELSNAIPFNCKYYSAICRTYSEFVRNGKLEDLYDAHWFCIGKVIGQKSGGESFDLLKGLPIGYLAKDQITQFFSGFSTETINVEITDTSLPGPSLVIAPLAIFT